MKDDDDIISVVVVKTTLTLIIMFIIIIMMMVMRMTKILETMMLEAPICENVLQILDMIIPKPGFRKSRDQALLQDTIESDPPEAPI